MTFKTILVHLADDKGHMTRFRLACDLASRFDAHIVALYITSPISMPGEIAGRGASLGYIAEAAETAREKAVAVKKEILSHCQRRNLSWEWRLEEGEHLETLGEYGHYADLAIVSHSRAELVEDRVMFHVPEHLPLVVGCPVIILPEEEDFPPPGKNIMIAWKGSREVLHTVRAALPFLKRAEKVIVLSVRSADQEGTPAERAVTFLARHGVTAEPHTETNGRQRMGEVILAHAHDSDVDLIVMGGYGHSRLRELMLGGATRYILHHLHVPVLMSH